MTNNTSKTEYLRQFGDAEGRQWEAFAADAIVAHGRPGAALAFRPSGSSDQIVLRSSITFNSHRAAQLAIRAMSGKELQRRLSLSRQAAGGV